MRKEIVKFSISIFLTIIILAGLSFPLGPLPPIGQLFNPASGIYLSAVGSEYPERLEISAPEVESTVIVYRDNYGVPHIFGSTTADAYFALGYLHARDRLWQMDTYKRLVSGRMSEVFGSSSLQSDIAMREIGFQRLAERIAQQPSDPESARITEAYAAGVNKYISELGEDIPFEFKFLGYRPEVWRPSDSIVFTLWLSWFMALPYDDLRMKLLWDKLGPESFNELFPRDKQFAEPVIPDESLLVVGVTPTRFEPVDDIEIDLTAAIKDILDKAAASEFGPGGNRAFGSNNWVIDGAKSASGKPILASDPHLPFQLPPIFYEVHIVSDELDVYGVTMPGGPSVIIGHNRHIAWGITNVGADVVDYYVEKVNPSNPDQYFSEGSWLTMKKNTEVIHVKGGEDVTIIVPETVHGPVLTQEGATISVKWVGFDTSLYKPGFLKINKARNYEEFVDALRDFNLPAQNIVYADVEGNIALWVAGKYPIRKNGIGMLPHNGSTGEFEWTGYVPFEEIPHALNPSQHYLASANQRSTSSIYPHYLANLASPNIAPGYRANRINRLLHDSQDITLEDMQKFQADSFDLAASILIPVLLEAVSNSEVTDPLVLEAVDSLRNWNFVVDKDLVAPTIWNAWFHRFRINTFKDEWDSAGLSDLFIPRIDVLQDFTVNNYPRWFDDVSTPDVETRDDIIILSLSQVVEELREEVGDELDEWRYGRYHVVEINHFFSGAGVKALDYPPQPRDGDVLTINVAWGWGERVSTGGPSWRMVIDMADVEGAAGVLPGGESGVPFSQHYTDQVGLWLNYRYHGLLFPLNPEELPPESIESTIIFKPR